MPTRQASAGFARRSFLQFLAANSSLLAARKPETSQSYYVGVGYSSNPYTAASRALAASGQFPANLAGRTVVIKPNLVVPKPSTSGATTDPQVVRAIVDLAIAAGATQIQIVEAALRGQPSNFTACGYTKVFQSYPQVELVDLRTGTYVLAPVPRGAYAYQSMWVPSVVMQANTFFISAAKMKTHENAVVSLSMKNLVGLGSEAAYDISRTKPIRQDLHMRGIDLSIVDLNLVRPVDFAVIDGVWAMQGQGPVRGTPVATDVVLAGLNRVAVDRVALNVMEIPQDAVPHLAYAVKSGLGPQTTANVTLLGDTYVSHAFVPAKTPPIVWEPSASPATISISAGQTTTITYAIRSECYTLVDIIQDSDETPGIAPIKTLHGFTLLPPPGESVVWDGTDSSGAPVAPGTYLARAQAAALPNSTAISYAVGRVTVTP